MHCVLYCLQTVRICQGKANVVCLDSCEVREAFRCHVSHVSVTLLAQENQHPHVDKVEGKKSCLM